MTIVPNDAELKESRILGEKYYRLRHKSGLDIYVFPKRLSAAYALFATRYGAADNEFRLAGDAEFSAVPDGIAHFLEHKLFENEDGSDAFELFAQTGASANAFTSSLTTAYLFSCTERFDESLGILLDMVTHPHFTKESIQKEQGIIAQEIRMGEDSPSNALYYGAIRAMYQVNHQRIAVAGTVDSIARITPELLYTCYRAFYNPGNMALFVCGNVTPEQVLSVADAHLSAVAPITVERHEEPEPKEVAAHRFYREMQVSKPLFSIAVKDTDVSGDPFVRMRRQCIMDILNEVLFSSSSPLRNGLYESGCIGPSLSYGYAVCSRYAYNMISGESADPEAVYARYTDYIASLQAAGVPPETFERCRRVVYANCVASYDDTSEIAHALMDAVFDGQELFDEPEIIASITQEEVNQALRSILQEEATVMAVVAPLGAELKIKEDVP